MKVDKKILSQWTIGVLCFAMLTTVTAVRPVFAQDEDEIPKPEDVQLETSDGVALSATYYPGTKEKESIPVILVHAWEKDQSTMVGMANTMQRRFGYAVIVPDLRGHGRSSKTTGGDELDRDRWRGNQLQAVMEDIEACKKFLINENNDGKCNIDMLCVVADGPSTILATMWTLRDWSYAPLGAMKQGQDVKALVLMNPVRNFKGLNGNTAFQNDLLTGRSGAAFPVIVAAERDKTREARNVYERMMRGRKSLTSKDKALEKYRFEIDQQRRMHKKRNGEMVPLDSLIGDFFEQQVFERRHDFRWAERGSK